MLLKLIPFGAFLFLLHPPLGHSSGDFWGLGFHYSRANNHALGLGYCYSENDFDIFNNGTLHLYGFSLLTDIAWSPRQEGIKYLGAKAMANMAQVILEERISTGIYKDFKDDSFFTLLSPEIGLTFLDLIGVYYGYNFIYFSNKSNGMIGHKVTFTLNIPVSIILEEL